MLFQRPRVTPRKDNQETPGFWSQGVVVKKGAIVTYLGHFHDILWGIVDTLGLALDGLGANTVRCKSLWYGIGGPWGLWTR